MAERKLTEMAGTSGGAERNLLDNQIRVSTPENISFQYEVVGPARRLVAYLVDVFLTLATFAVVVVLGAMLLGLLAGLVQGTVLAAFVDMLAGFAGTLMLVGGFLSLWFYGAAMEATYNGQTLGKRMANIRAISADGGSIDGTQATLRNFFRLIDVSPIVPVSLFFGADAESIAVPIFAFGLVCMTLSPQYQRLGDFVAGTIVVSESKKWTHGLATFDDPRVAELAGMIPDDFAVSRSLAQSLSEYVDRRRVLPYPRTADIARHAGRPLIRKFGLPSDTNHDLLLCALYYRTFVADADLAENPFAKFGSNEAEDRLLNSEPAESARTEDVS